jgi:sporulation protein YlmC with PRC-barrel domain
MMFYRFEKLNGRPIEATDGEVGKVKDIYFDDRRWAVRYLVVETGSWLAGRKVLISPISVKSIDWENNVAQVGLTQQQVRASPNIDTDKPVSRQHERDFFNYYGYPYYWSGPGLWGTASYPVSPVGYVPPVTNSPGEHGEAPADPHLRSAQEVTGYRLQTIDGSIGHVEDFLLDSVSWAIRYLVVDTRNWLPGKHLVIPPQWIRDVDWSERVVNVDVTRDTVQAAPEYNSSIEFSRAHETNLFRHYHREGYWQ